MKKLENLALLKYKTMTAPQMKNIAGGYGGGYSGSGTYDDPFILPGVYVTGCYCKACVEFEKMNNPHRLSGGDYSNNRVILPFGEWLLKEFVYKHASCCPWHD